jgi:hypothetical protein
MEGEMELLVVLLLVLCALVFMVHAWRATLVVFALLAVLVVVGSLLPKQSGASYDCNWHADGSQLCTRR